MPYDTRVLIYAPDEPEPERSDLILFCTTEGGSKVYLAPSRELERLMEES